MDLEIIALFKKYISNSCSEEELMQIADIIKSGKYEEEWSVIIQDDGLYHIANPAESTEPTFDAGRVFKRIDASINPQKQLIPYQWLIGVAATLLIGLSVGYMFWKGSFANTDKTYIVQQITRSGQQKIITLSDGTKVTLNNASKLSYASVFGNNKREVYLTGEAFFDVKHDTNRPFLVHTSQLNVQVLGTSFDVKSYRADAKTTVSVATGKVGVSSKNVAATQMLLPGNQLAYTDNDTRFVKTDIGADEIIAWQNGILTFKQEAISDVKADLQRWFNVTIIIHRNALLNKRVTASFTRKSLPDVLNILSQTVGFTYKINKNEVHIY
jgi:ferric-dicitrate binding protein FerR (iron transport regulator)